MNLNDIAHQHHAWVERMGWHNKSVLESLALIGSETGEAAAECLLGIPSCRFGEELADIILRTLDLAMTEGVDAQAELEKAKPTWQSEGLLARFGELSVDMAKWVNSARSIPVGASFPEHLGTVLARVYDLAQQAGVDLSAELQNKMARNNLNGTRGRRI